ncbi:histone-lysine N-methyltransferase, H3 lysine-79 specific-like [Rhopilema esculentum]|uniref:histone-lysine N-methyltransferase, H3 lysine-79 specific-like n=1 Tax=Rhopilema esculentum TaxID=499914 RepID=UPI0031DA36B4|eukprot:gene13078-3862_t
MELQYQGEKELAAVASEKQVIKKESCFCLSDNFTKQTNTKIEKDTKQIGASTDSGIEIFEANKKALEDENKLLKKKIEELIQSKEDMDNEMERMREDNRKETEMVTLKALVSEVVMKALEEVILERGKRFEIESEKLKVKLKFEYQRQELLERQIKCAEEKRLSVEEKLAEQEELIRKRERQLVDTEQRLDSLQEKKSLLSGKFGAAQERLKIVSEEFGAEAERSTSGAITDEAAEEDNSNNNSSNNNNTKSLEMQLQKIENIQKANKELERQYMIANDSLNAEKRKHMEHIVALTTDIDALKKEKGDLASEVKEIRSLNQELETQMMELGQQETENRQERMKLEVENQDIRVKNEELSHRLNQKSLNKPWWRRAVSCG